MAAARALVSGLVTESMVHASSLRKSFGDLEAVRGIDVDIRKGEAFGFLGPNGAGKSSTMRMIAAVSPVTGGTMRILGMDPSTDGPAIRRSAEHTTELPSLMRLTED